jgi:hypothetical protein
VIAIVLSEIRTGNLPNTKLLQAETVCSVISYQLRFGGNARRSAGIFVYNILLTYSMEQIPS